MEKQQGILGKVNRRAMFKLNLGDAVARCQRKSRFHGFAVLRLFPSVIQLDVLAIPSGKAYVSFDVSEADFARVSFVGATRSWCFESESSQQNETGEKGRKPKVAWFHRRTPDRENRAYRWDALGVFAVSSLSRIL
jgi:hypothetical protein